MWVIAWNLKWNKQKSCPKCRSTYWDESRKCSAGQRKHESAKLSTELGLKCVTTKIVSQKRHLVLCYIFASNRNKPWIRNSVWFRIDQRRNLKAKMLDAWKPQSKQQLRIEYNNAEKDIKESAKRDKQQHLNDIATYAENAAYRNDLRGVYAAITKLTSSIYSSS